MQILVRHALSHIHLQYEQMRTTFWTLAAIIAATTGLTNAVSIAGNTRTAIESADMNLAETDVFVNPAKTQKKKKPAPKLTP